MPRSGTATRLPGDHYKALGAILGGEEIMSYDTWADNLGKRESIVMYRPGMTFEPAKRRSADCPPTMTQAQFEATLRAPLFDGELEQPNLGWHDSEELDQ